MLWWLSLSVMIVQHSYHPAAQERSPTEAKQGWAGQYLDGRLLGKLGCCWKRCQWGQQGVLTLWSVWVLTPQYSDGETILSKAPSFGWDVNTRSWLSVVIKNTRMSFEKDRGVTPASWPNSPVGLCPSWPPNHPHTPIWLHHFISSPPVSWCVVGVLAHYGCRHIIRVDAAHWWWLRIFPPSM